MRDRARIAHWHDAALTASNADRPVVFINAPWQSHRAAACDALLPIVVSSLRCHVLLRGTRTTTLPTCPSIALDDRSYDPHDLPARHSSDTRPKRAGTHLFDEACAKRGTGAAGNL